MFIRYWNTAIHQKHSNRQLQTFVTDIIFVYITVQ